MKKFFSLMLLLTATCCWAQGNNAKLSPDLRNLNASSAQVIVQYNSAPSLLDLNLLGTLGSILNSLPLVNGIAVEEYSVAFESGERKVHQP